MARTHRLGLGLAFLTVSLATGAPAQSPPASHLQILLEEAWQIINTHYINPRFNRVNWQQVRQNLLRREYTSTAQAYAALRSAIAKLGDPYTRFLDPQEFQALVQQTAGAFAGVGVRLRLEDDQDPPRLIIAEVMADSPAAQAGIQPGDELVSIAGRSARTLSLEQASRLLRGPVGTVLRLEIRRPGAPETLPLQLTRAWIATPAVDYALKREQGWTIGLIRLSSFHAQAAVQMRQALQSLQQQGAQAYILDLRGNPGGLLSASIEITRLWLSQGRIVSTVGRRGHQVFQANRSALVTEPLAILVDHRSASASEIVAGALQDHRRAVVIGTPTFGKGVVQAVYRLRDGSGLTVTVAHYYTPAGRNLAHRGIHPDIVVTLSRATRQSLPQRAADVTPQRDPVYAQAVAWLVQRRANR